MQRIIRFNYLNKSELMNDLTNLKKQAFKIFLKENKSPYFYIFIDNVEILGGLSLTSLLNL